MGPEQKVAFAKSHTTAMGQQIANGHFVRDVGIVHLKTGQALINGIIPGEFALVDERSKSRGSEGFGVRADAEKRIFIDGHGLAQLADSIASGEYDLSIFDDAERDARNVESLQCARNVGVEVRRRSILRARRRCKP